ncbi:MAG: hypothetical protein IKQ91_02935 [Oscillospiraceae bacterium]|nr:hypothetical protein [Oscillospiraceae bacterium]
MKKRTKKAAMIAAFGYISVVGFGLGMLKAAQQTRQTLYGGKPVLAQITHQDLPDASTAEIVLGGGEWTIQIQTPETAEAMKAAEQMPPSIGKLILRLAVLSDQAADYTAELIAGESSFSF